MKNTASFLFLNRAKAFRPSASARDLEVPLFVGQSGSVNEYNEENVSAYADNYFTKNANLLISLSQMSETLCILLIPMCLKRFGIKGVMLMAMFAWVLRFGFFGLGNPGSGVWLFILSMIVYGIAFDFFNVSGSLYVDKQTSPEIRSSAQGLFMIMTNGIGASVGTFCAQGVVNHFVFSHADPVEQLEGWRISWFCFSGFALAVAILFMLIFRDDHIPGAHRLSLCPEHKIESFLQH